MRQHSLAARHRHSRCECRGHGARCTNVEGAIRISYEFDVNYTVNARFFFNFVHFAAHSVTNDGTKRGAPGSKRRP